MEISFFALPSQQGPVQGRFKPAHLLISLSTKVAACVRRFETPTALNYGRTESKKRHPHARLKINFKELKCYLSFKFFCKMGAETPWIE